MKPLKYLDFDLAIGRREKEYLAQVVYSPAGEAASVFSFPFQQNELEDLLHRIGFGREAVRGYCSPPLAAAQELGSRLFEAVFQNEVRSCYRGSLEASYAQEGAGLRLKLRFGSASGGQGVPELADLPWEFLFDPAFNRFLAQSTQTPIVRYLELPQRIAPLSVHPPLRLLVMAASPAGYPRLDLDGERARLQAALQPLVEAGLVLVTWLECASLADLQQTLREAEFHVFHFIGHGGFDPQTEESVLLLENGQGAGLAVDALRMGVMLHDAQYSLRLAVLNACEGARNSPRDPFAGVAANLVRQGIPAVVAMQFEISDSAAVLFAQEFYGAIAQDFPVDAAVAEARKAIYFQPNDIEWATPVLYMRSPDGALFELAQNRASAGCEASANPPAVVESESDNPHPPPAGLVRENGSRPGCLRLAGHRCSITSLVFSPNGALLASASADRTVRLWRTSDGASLAVLGGHNGSINDVAFTPDGLGLVSASSDRNLILWRVPEGVILSVLLGHTGAVTSVAFSPDGRILASGSLDRTIRFWRVPDGSPLHAIIKVPDGIHSLAFSPDGALLATAPAPDARRPQTISLWRAADGKLLRTMRGHAACVNSLAFTPDGKYLASGSADHEIRLWQLADGKSSLLGWNTVGVNSVVFFPGGDRLASGLDDRTVQLRQVPDGILLYTLQGHTGRVTRVAASPDGCTLASGSNENTVRIWKLGSRIPHLRN